MLVYKDHMFPEKAERNERLVKERNSTNPPVSWEKLAEIYGISPTQAKRLYDQHAHKYEPSCTQNPDTK
jgi:hypothetical protein